MNRPSGKADDLLKNTIAFPSSHCVLKFLLNLWVDKLCTVLHFRPLHPLLGLDMLSRALSCAPHTARETSVTAFQPSW